MVGLLNNGLDEAPVAKQYLIIDREQIYTWILELNDPKTRTNALHELKAIREVFPEMALILWHSFGTIASLLQEITKVYATFVPPCLSTSQSNRVCHAIALFQCVAAHPDTRSLFLRANIALHLYPLMSCGPRTKPYDYLRLASLGVIGALVKADDPDVVKFLLNTEIIPICLAIMKEGIYHCKNLAIYIMSKILSDENGLSYVCATYERFSEVAISLGKMVLTLSNPPIPKLLKHIVHCYFNLSFNLRAREALTKCLPDQIRDPQFTACLNDDEGKQWLAELILNVDTPLSQPLTRVSIGKPTNGNNA